MKLEDLPIEQAVGAILVHHLIGADGRKLLSKGHRITAEDVDKLRALGKPTIFVATLEPDDVREDDAAMRLARAVAGSRVELTKPSGGRVNFLATQKGFLRVNRNVLKSLNDLPGITLATKPGYSIVAPKKMVATIKTIGLALPASILRNAQAIVDAHGKAFDIVAPQIQRVAILLTGSENGRQRTEETLLPPIRARVEEIGAQVIAEVFCDEAADAIQKAIAGLVNVGAQLIIQAGETSVMDADDIVPRGIKDAGGVIELYGAPVEPGNLLLLAYRGNVPVLGAPGCVKSRETNVVDLILPRLMLGERVTKADVIEMADGGLLIA